MRKRAQTRKSGERVTREKLPKRTARFNGLSHDFDEKSGLLRGAVGRQMGAFFCLLLRHHASSLLMKSSDPLAGCIRTIRGQRVVLDADLARLYDVPTFRLNEAVKRNAERFPDDFRFQLRRDELAALLSQIAMSKGGRGGRRTLPWVFNEHGSLMAATVLNSSMAVKRSLYVVRAFVQMREAVASNQAVLRRLAEIDRTLLEHDAALRTLWTKLRPLLSAPPEPPTKEMGFHVELRKKR